MKRKTQKQKTISILSIGLIEHALFVLQHDAFPVYQRNIERRDPPFAHGEYSPSGVAVVLLCAGLDSHLARLKWMRDICIVDPPYPHTPYFNWDIDHALSTKIKMLLFFKKEDRLKQQLLEFVAVRDCVVHPKVFEIEDEMSSDLSFSKPIATLSKGSEIRNQKNISNPKRPELTRILNLPLVPTWISYPDAVICVLVLTRFLLVLEKKYENPFAWVGGLMMKNVMKGFTNRRKDQTTWNLSIEEWARCFFNSLSTNDQKIVKGRLGSKLALYLQKPIPPLRKRKESMSEIIWEMQHPSPPKFLKHPPPWSGSHKQKKKVRP